MADIPTVVLDDINEEFLDPSQLAPPIVAPAVPDPFNLHFGLIDGSQALEIGKTVKLRPPQIHDPFVKVFHTELITKRSDHTIRPVPLINLRPANIASYLAEMTRNRLVFAQGPPGSGKSTVAFYAAQRAAMESQDLPIVWMSLTTGVLITFYRGYLTSQYLPPDSEISQLEFHKWTVSHGKPVKHARDQKVHCLYIDGVNKVNRVHLALHRWENDLRIPGFGQAYIKIITSEQVAVPTPHDYTKVLMMPWTFDDFVTLCTNEDFFNSVVVQLGGRRTNVYPYDDASRRALLQYKYFFAGRSARYMFEKRVSEVKDELQRAMGEIIDRESFFQMNVGENNMQAVNRLMIKVDGFSQIISEFVVRCFQQRFSRVEIAMLHRNQFVRRNAVMDGWALESDFIHSAKNDLFGGRLFDVIFPPDGVPTRGAANTSFARGTGRVISFYRNEPVQINAAADIVAGNFFVPDVYNQGGYDLVQVVPGLVATPLILRFVQVTRREDHGIKLHYMRVFLNAVNTALAISGLPIITNIEVVMAYPTDLIDRVPDPQNAPAGWTVVGAPRNDDPTVTYHTVVFDRLT